MMKVVKEVAVKKPKVRAFQQRLRDELCERLDALALKNKVSRNRLIEAVLEQVVADKTFVLRIKE
jgi:predicted transcriptional regulator